MDTQSRFHSVILSLRDLLPKRGLEKPSLKGAEKTTGLVLTLSVIPRTQFRLMPEENWQPSAMK
jgi:hypothetical protein